MNARLERLAAAGFQLVPADITSHFIIEREGCVAFIERRGEDFGNIGAPGLMTERGFAALVWRANQGFFVGKGFEQPATDEQVLRLRGFAQDLNAAMGSDSNPR